MRDNDGLRRGVVAGSMTCLVDLQAQKAEVVQALLCGRGSDQALAQRTGLETPLALSLRRGTMQISRVLLDAVRCLCPQ